ncbi:MAG: CRTAC1 family protein [Pseudomonadota bacterium]
MTEEPQDDVVIGNAFWRSLKLAAMAAGVLIIVFAAKHWIEQAATPIEDAELIAPQSIESTTATAPPNLPFTDITELAGIDHLHVSGATGERMLPETMGGGVAFFDYNDDGHADLLFVSGSEWPWSDNESEQSSLILYRGNGDGTFQDVTDAMGLSTSLYGMGVAVGDYDSDGDVDVFVTAVGENQLFENRGTSGFVDVTASANVAGESTAWSTGAAFVDVDNDSDLDLFVLNYVEWSRDIDLEVDYQLTGIGRAYGPPTNYAGTHAYLYRNDGGRFVDISVDSGVQVNNPATGQPLGKGLAVLPLDVNTDGWIDLIVANDTVQNFVFVNNAGQGFEERGVELGIAFDNSGSATGAMGIDAATVDPNGDLMVGIGNFANEMTSLFVRPNDGTVFTDEAIVSGVGPATRQALTFGVFFFDVDLDGRMDFLQVNGHVEDEINVVQPSQQHAQAPQLFWNCGDQCQRQFVLVEDTGDLGVPMVGRGAAYADIDHDGDLDIVVTQAGRAPRLFRNDQALGNHWIQWDIRDANGAPALGAAVSLNDDESVMQTLEITRSYLSQVDSVVTVGLGNSSSAEQVEIVWPDGERQPVPTTTINTRITIQRESSD